VVKYRKIPPAAAANQIAENARIPPAADLQKNKYMLFTGCEVRMRKTVTEVLHANYLTSVRLCILKRGRQKLKDKHGINMKTRENLQETHKKTYSFS
jgi:hypothetical protein